MAIVHGKFKKLKVTNIVLTYPNKAIIIYFWFENIFPLSCLYFFEEWNVTPLLVKREKLDLGSTKYRIRLSFCQIDCAVKVL